MKHSTRKTQGFSLVELLAVVLVLAVLAAVAIPLYLNTRKSAAARTCKANLTALAAAEAAFVVRHGRFNTTPMVDYNATDPLSGGLVGEPEGITPPLNGPGDGAAYTIAGGGVGEPLTISCPHCATAKGGDNAHEAISPSPDGFSFYYRTLSAPATEQ